MADLLRFKDIFTEGHPLAKPLSLNDMHVTEYRPGEDELVNYAAYRRRKNVRGGGTIGGPVYEDVDEALNMQQRLKRGRIMRRMKSKIKIGRERAKRKMANKQTLEKRTMKAARKKIFLKLSKGVRKEDMPFARRQEIEKRLDKPQVKARIKMLAKRMFKDVRKREVERKKG